MKQKLKLLRKKIIAPTACCVNVGLALGFSSTALSQTNTTWNGGNGEWSDPANWSSGVPHNFGTTWNVFIDGGAAGGSSVSLNQNATINQLNISAGDLLDIADSRTLIIIRNAQLGSGELHNDGTVNVAGTGSSTLLNFSGATSIDGSGTLFLFGGPNSRIGGSGVLTHGANHTIQGTGNLGNGALSIINNGKIQAGSGDLLLIDPVNLGTFIPSFVNGGLVRAFDGGVINLTGAGFGEFGGSGVYTADVGSTINLVGGAIARNTNFSTIGNGEIRVLSGSNATLQNVTLDGLLIRENNGNVTVVSALVNSGTIVLDGSGQTTSLNVSGTVDLSGGGSLQLVGGDNTRIAGSGILNNIDNTISGSGNLGGNTIEVNSQGIIQAGAGESLLIDPRNNGTGISAFNNHGIVRAVDGGIVTLTGSGFGEFSGTGSYVAEDGSRIDLTNDSTSRNTDFVTNGSGVVRAVAGTDSLWENVSFSGNFVRENNGAIRVVSSLENAGILRLEGTGDATSLTLTGSTILNGAGSIQMFGGDNTRINGVGTLTNVDNTISGSGVLGANQLEVINQGTIQAGSGDSMTIDPRNNGTNNIAFNNQNLVRAFDGGQIDLTGNGFGEFGGTGVYSAEDNSTLRLLNGAIVRDTNFTTSGTGEIVVEAGHSATLDNVSLAGNLVRENDGTLNITAGIENSGDIHLNGSGSATTLAISGQVTVNGGGTIRMSGGPTTRISGSGTFDNVDNTISGSGNFGSNAIAINNSGVVQAGAGEAMTIDPRNNGTGNVAFENTGTVRAVDGGTITMTGSGFGEFGGNGNYEAINGGSLIYDENAIQQNLVSGVLQSGQWHVVDDGSGTAIRMRNNTIAPVQTIGANASVELSGVDSNFTFQTANLSIDSSLKSVQGNLILANGRSMTLANQLENSGNILINGAATSLSVTGDFSQSGGVITLNNSTLEFLGQSNVATGGIIRGTGQIVGDLSFNNTAVIAPGSSPGLLSFDGDLGWGAGGIVAFDLGPNAFESDFVSITGSLLKNGMGDYAFEFLDNGWVVGQTYDLIQFDATNFQLSDFSVFNSEMIVGSFGFSGGNTLQFTVVSAVPEPSSFALLVLAASTWKLNRRRKRIGKSGPREIEASRHPDREST